MLPNLTGLSIGPADVAVHPFSPPTVMQDLPDDDHIPSFPPGYDEAYRRWVDAGAAYIYKYGVLDENAPPMPQIVREFQREYSAWQRRRGVTDLEPDLGVLGFEANEREGRVDSHNQWVDDMKELQEKYLDRLSLARLRRRPDPPKPRELEEYEEFLRERELQRHLAAARTQDDEARRGAIESKAREERQREAQRLPGWDVSPPMPPGLGIRQRP